MIFKTILSIHQCVFVGILLCLPVSESQTETTETTHTFTAVSDSTIANTTNVSESSASVTTSPDITNGSTTITTTMREYQNETTFTSDSTIITTTEFSDSIASVTTSLEITNESTTITRTTTIGDSQNETTHTSDSTIVSTTNVSDSIASVTTSPEITNESTTITTINESQNETTYTSDSTIVNTTNFSDSSASVTTSLEITNGSTTTTTTTTTTTSNITQCYDCMGEVEYCRNNKTGISCPTSTCYITLNTNQSLDSISRNQNITMGCAQNTSECVYSANLTWCTSGVPCMLCCSRTWCNLETLEKTFYSDSSTTQISTTTNSTDSSQTATTEASLSSASTTTTINNDTTSTVITPLSSVVLNITSPSTNTELGTATITLSSSSATPTTSSPSSCDVGGSYSCLMKFQQLVQTAYKEPDLMFGAFCSSMPTIIRCLTDSIEGCQGNCSDRNYNQINGTLEMIFREMASQCPTSCDMKAGFNCTVDYFNGVVDALTDNINCTSVNSVQKMQARCRLRTVGSCGASIRDTVNVSYTALERESSRICNVSITVPANFTNVTETPQCQQMLAVECIKDLGWSILSYFDGSNDVNTLCGDVKLKHACYLNASSSCSNKLKFSLDVAWNFTEALIAGVCIEAVIPVCNPVKARGCILDLWTQVDLVKDFQAACNLMPYTIKCVTDTMVGCSASDQLAMNSSLINVVGLIGNRCDNIVEIIGNSTIEITEGGGAGQIGFIFTQSPSSLCGSTANCSVYIDIGIEVGTSPRCRNGKAIAQAVLTANDNTTSNLCSRQVTDSNWNVVQNVTVTAKMDFKYDGTQVRLMFLWYRKVVNGVVKEKRCLQNFTLIIHDNDVPAICSSINDPHTTTFDGWYFNNFREGHFVLYRHKSLPYEVQIVTQRCNVRASCNCAAAIRSGDTVIYIDRCRKKSFMARFCGHDKYSCVNLMKTSLFGHNRITPGTRIYSRINGKEISVTFPHGTSVKVSVNGDYLNVWVTASPIDWKNTLGLCGSYDKNPNNDLVLRNGSMFNGDGNGRGKQPDGWTTNWGVKSGEYIYAGVPMNQYTPPWYCECRSAGGCDSPNVTSSCGSSVIMETCDLDTSGVEMKATFETETKSSRKKRAVDTTGPDPDQDVDITADPLPPANLITETEATRICAEYFRQSATAQICQSNNVTSNDSLNNNLQGCVDDLVVTGNDTWMMAALDALKENCLSELSKNSNISNSIVGDIQSVSCPNQCNGQGTCSNGSCVCNATYSGDDCGIALNAKLEFVYLYANTCDVRVSDCSQAQVLGSGFIPNVTKCLIQQIEVNGNLISSIGDPEKVNNTFVSPNEIHCHLSTTTSSYNVSLMNSQASDPSIFLIYDSVCFTCLFNPTASCTKLKSSCVIDKHCYGPGEENPVDSCKICRPEKSESEWSNSDSSSCSSSPNIPLIVGLCVGLGGGLIIIIAVIVGIVIWKCTCTKTTNLLDEGRYEYPERHSRRTDEYLNLSYNNQGEVSPPSYNEDDKEQHYAIMKDSEAARV